MNIKINNIYKVVLSICFTACFAARAEYKNKFNSSLDNLQRICKGEFSENIVQSAQACSSEDLNKAYSEISILEQKVREANVEIINLSNERSQTQSIMYSNIKPAIAGALIAFGGVGTLTSMGVYGPKFYKKTAGWGSLLTLAMAGMFAKSMINDIERSSSIEYHEIPNLKAFIEEAQAQIKVRKAVVAAMISLKNQAQK